jgi:predicted ribosome quality control (RQC) complex YloA/Tae2 family protein
MESKNFRKFQTSSGKLALAGKTAEQNEEIIAQAGKEETVLHTKEAGSSFCNIKEGKEKESGKDIKEAAVFCARYSRDWKKNKKNVEVHIFKGKDVYKSKDMKTGTFGVKKFKAMTARKEDIMKLAAKEGLK